MNSEVETHTAAAVATTTLQKPEEMSPMNSETTATTFLMEDDDDDDDDSSSVKSTTKESVVVVVDEKSPSDNQPKKRAGNNNTVSFSAIKIRHYKQTIGDHPSVSYGPPISLDWKYSEKSLVDVSDYEENRQGTRRKNLKDMQMNYYSRKDTLIQLGHTKEDIKSASKDANKTQRQRAFTKALLPLCKVEEVMQSAKRKMKRAVKKRYTSV